MDTNNPAAGLRQALEAPSSSARLQAALAAGTRPHPDFIGVLIQRSATETDFFVRDMLTWALTRHPSDLTVPLLLEQTQTEAAQARSQALHTLSKIGDGRGWMPARALLDDPDDEVARSAWRTAVALLPEGEEAELAAALAAQLGRGDREVQRSLSRALAALGEEAEQVLATAAATGSPAARTHAIATARLLHDPDEDFDAALLEAKRIDALAHAPTVADHADR